MKNTSKPVGTKNRIMKTSFHFINLILRRKFCLVCFLFICSSPILVSQTSCDCQPGDGTLQTIPIGETIYASDVFPNFVYQDYCIEVGENATLIIDDPTNFINTIFIMGAGAEIKIASFSTLFVGNSTLRGCTNMWKGITLSGNSHFHLNFSTVTDAQYAIRASENAVLLDVKNNTFDNNEVGIFIAPSGFEPIDMTGTFGTPLILDENTFTISDNLLPMFIGQEQTPSTDALTPCGILLKNTLGAIGYGLGNDNYYNNYFFNLKTGIRIHGGLVGVMGTQIDPQGESPSFGIVASNSFLYAYDNIINNSSVGIYSYKVWNIKQGGFLSARDNQISNCLFSGILSQSVYWGTHIEDNNLTNASIRLTAPTFGADTKIEGNTIIEGNIDVNLAQGTGIFTEEPPYYSSGNFGTITENTINFTNSNFAIRVSNSIGQFVYDNTITMNGQNSSTGVLILNSEEVGIKDNIIHSTTTNGNHIGIRTVASTNSHYCCNTLTGVTTGLEFSGMCYPSFIRQTDITGTEYGLYCSNGTTLGPQGQETLSGFGNKWLGTFGIEAAFHGGSIQEIADSRFYAEDIAPYWPSPNVDPTWFVPNNIEALTCLTENKCEHPYFPFSLVGGGSTEDLLIKGVDIRTANSGYTTSIYSDMLNWESGKNLLRRIKQYPNLLGQNTEVDTFYSTSMTTNMNKLTSVKKQIRDVSTFDENSLKSLVESREAIFEKLKEINSIDSTSIITTDSIELSNLEHQRLLALQDLISSFTSTNDLMDSLNLERIKASEGIKMLNYGIIPTSIFESNEKTVNDVYLKTVAEGIFLLDSIQFNVISTIAHQCPKEGGRVVYLARTLYNFNVSKDFDDELLCQGGQQRFEKEEYNYSDFHIYPNPVKSVLNIELGNKNIDRVEIHTPMGECKFKKSIFFNQHTLEVDVNNLPSGLYFCSFYRNDKIVKSQKILITH